MTEYNYERPKDPLEDFIKTSIEGDKSKGFKQKGKRYFLLVLVGGIIIVSISLFFIFNGDWISLSDPNIVRWDYVTENIGGFEFFLVGIVFIFVAVKRLWRSKK